MTSLSTIISSINTYQAIDLRHSAIANKDVSKITSLDMLLLTKTLESKIGLRDGRNTIKLLCAKVASMVKDGSIPNCEAAHYSPPSPRMTVGELKRILLRFELIERKLIVFALATRLDLLQASLLQYKDIQNLINSNKWSPEIVSFLKSIPRHITSPFVFWEFDIDNQASAMIDFERRFEQIVKANWIPFSKVCENLIPVDGDADAKEIATMFVLESAHSPTPCNVV